MFESDMIEDDGDFDVSYEIQYDGDPNQPDECPQMLEDAEEFERAVKRYSKVKRVTASEASKLMLSNSALLKEWGVR
jgi:hypothetical protein